MIFQKVSENYFLKTNNIKAIDVSISKKVFCYIENKFVLSKKFKSTKFWIKIKKYFYN